MKTKLLIAIILIIGFVANIYSQKKSLSVECYDDWKNIKSVKISNNGQWATYELNPQDGDGNLVIVNTENTESKMVTRGYNASILPNSNAVVFKIKPQVDTVRKMKRAKKKKDELPTDSLGIYIIQKDSIVKYDRVKSYKIAKETSNWIVLHHLKDLEQKKDTTANDTVNLKKEKKKKTKKVKDFPETSSLRIINVMGDEQYQFDSISEYAISKNGRLLSFVRITYDSLIRSTVYIFNTEKKLLDSLKIQRGISKKLALDHKGTQLGWLHTYDTTKTKVFALNYWNEDEGISNTIVDTVSNRIKKNWSVSEYSGVWFSDNDKRMYFGTAPRPIPEPKDTLLEEEKVKIDIWHWNDPLIQSQQLVNLESDKKKTYRAVYHIKENKVVQLADSTITRIKTVLRGNGDIALGYNKLPYQKYITWKAGEFKDVYKIDVMTGKKDIIVKNTRSYNGISWGGNYFIWFSSADSNWYCKSLITNKEVCLTNGIDAVFYDDSHDYPYPTPSNGYGGWTTNDRQIFVYDKFDIWKIDPDGKEQPINVTNGYGNKNKIRFRIRKLDEEAFYLSEKESLILEAFNTETMASGVFKASTKGKIDPVQLVLKDKRVGNISKAKEAEKVLWSQQSYLEYPDVLCSDMDFKSTTKLSNANPQMKDYKWGTVELVKWINTDGEEMKGLLYKPEDFDSTKKYPMIVYFYRFYSDMLHAHWTPKPSRSIVNFTHYASNDYVVFVPDIKFKIGYPGESAYNNVISGTLDIVSKGYIDKERIGIQGQSWGGYQVAYIVTKTDMFAAASPGAPVSNMISAYGGIRWGSGMSRAFQYEQTQSRIGGTPWEKPFHYIENSPVFYAPKINTPLLIRHDDDDGAVPWYQGIELYIAMRRLEKPAWLLNYNDAPHNLTKKRSNQIDWTIRMKQFFDHYLKDEPAPVWLEKGIPAMQKGKTMGYELVD